HVVAGSAQRTAGQLLGAEHAHHDGVGEHHQDMGQLRGNQRTSQAKEGSQLAAGGLRHDESGSGNELPDRNRQRENDAIFRSMSALYKRKKAMPYMIKTHR